MLTLIYYVLYIIHTRTHTRTNIGRVSIAFENEAGGTWVSYAFFPMTMLNNRTLFCVLAAIIELSPNTADSFIFRRIITSRNSGTFRL